MSNEGNALKLGVKFKPPCIIILYKTEGNKFRKRCMPVRDINRNSDCYSLAQKIKRRHDKALFSVPAVQIEKVLRLLQITMLGASLEEAKRDVEKEFTINFDEDMNLLSDKDLKRRKELMDLQFEKNRVQVDDPNFIYDKQVEFTSEKVESGWDDEEQEDFWG